MKQTLFAIMAVTLVVGLTGCSAMRRGFTGIMPGSCHDAPEACAPCGGCGDCGDCGDCGKIGGACPTLRGRLKCCGICDPCRSGLFGRCCGGGPVAHGPPTGAVAYPYYTLRGPRDFLVDNPPSIGP